MRYAIPVSDGVLDQHFGHCQAFALIDADEDSKVVKSKEIVLSPGHQPGILPGWLAEQGVSVVIAGGMGTRAQDLFWQNRIHVVIGAPSVDPEEIVREYLKGNLDTGDNTCDH